MNKVAADGKAYGTEQQQINGKAGRVGGPAVQTARAENTTLRVAAYCCHCALHRQNEVASGGCCSNRTTEPAEAALGPWLR